MPRQAELTEIKLPDFGYPTQEPIIPRRTYLERISLLRERALREGLDAFVIYGDREHYGNITWLTGFDPRFEEALLIIDLHRSMKKPVLLVGNEGLGYIGISPISDSLEVVLYQSFSLVSQPRGDSPALEKIMRKNGVNKGVNIGVAGWKYYTSQEFHDPKHTLEIPSFIVDKFRRIAGRDNVINAGRLLLDPSEGIRAVNDLDQLAYFEYIGTITSQALRDMIFGLRPGMTEHEAVRLMKLSGVPLSCHLMLSSGPRAFMGLPSPSSRVIERGDPLTVAYGAWGSLNARAGFVASSEADLPATIRDYIPKLVTPYFEAIATWYEKLKLGVTGNKLYRAVHSRLNEPFYGVKLNPGHLTNLEEWLSSPIYSDSTEKLASGMAVQVDVIPATGSQYFTTNIEDTIAMADSKLRSEFAGRYPEAWDRIVARRDFMMNQLGIRLHRDVLSFSNIPAYLPPFFLAPEKAMRLV